MKPKILLHVCCAPCSTQSIEELKKDYDVTLFFYNPNIHPKEEYEKRLNEAKKISKILGLPLIEGEYDKDAWLEAVKGFENEPENGKRCAICYEFRLKKSSEKAKDFDFFTTTLTISPHKNSEVINEIGSKINHKFLKKNFKKKDGFRKSIELSKKHNLYRQDYCGCIYSLKSSIASPKE